MLPGGCTVLPGAVTVHRNIELVAMPGSALTDTGKPPVGAWTFGGTVPGPQLRAVQGERLRIAVSNRLSEPTTVHWHGVRVPHAMDGVPHLKSRLRPDKLARMRPHRRLDAAL